MTPSQRRRLGVALGFSPSAQIPTEEELLEQAVRMRRTLRAQADRAVALVDLVIKLGGTPPPL